MAILVCESATLNPVSNVVKEIILDLDSRLSSNQAVLAIRAAGKMNNLRRFSGTTGSNPTLSAILRPRGLRMARHPEAIAWDFAWSMGTAHVVCVHSEEREGWPALCRLDR